MNRFNKFHKTLSRIELCFNSFSSKYKKAEIALNDNRKK